MQHKEVVTVFLVRSDTGQVLVARRSQHVGTYRGRWAGISGYLEEAPEAQARRELREETGLGDADVRLLRAGAPLAVEDTALDTRWTVHPFLFEAVRPDGVRLDREHTEFTWLPPADIAGLEAVPALAEALAAVWP